jgi:hypothetical protein
MASEQEIVGLLFGPENRRRLRASVMSSSRLEACTVGERDLCPN